jgi:hypothetical protein
VRAFDAEFKGKESDHEQCLAGYRKKLAAALDLWVAQRFSAAITALF